MGDSPHCQHIAVLGTGECHKQFSNLYGPSISLLEIGLSPTRPLSGSVSLITTFHCICLHVGVCLNLSTSWNGFANNKMSLGTGECEKQFWNLYGPSTSLLEIELVQLAVVWICFTQHYFSYDPIWCM